MSEKPVIEVKKKPRRSFDEFCRIMKEFDEDILDMTIEEFSELVNEDLPKKVDGCKEHLDYIDMRFDFLKKKKDDFAAAQKVIDNAKKRFKEYMVYAMENGKVEKVKGGSYNLRLQSKKTVSPLDFEITTNHFIEFNTIVKGSVKRTYSIDAKMFKLVCDKNPDIKEKYTQESTSKFPVFTVRKDR